MTRSRNSTVRRVILYARLSVATEESVSVERQLDAGRKYADARGWRVIAEHADEGVSATRNRPEDRRGWRAVLDSTEAYDAVIVWKVDRLARRVLDFLHADESLRDRGAGLVAVEDPIDMTTAQGRAFATMLAVFGEMEAAAISARATAARAALLAAGRRAGGRPPYGWRNVPNPDGPGVVLAIDPERSPVVTEMAGRALAGASLYGIMAWLRDSGIPTRPRRPRGAAPDAEPVSAPWTEASVEAVLRNPVLAGMTPYAPGRKPGEGPRPGTEGVLRGADGLPIVDESVAIMTPAEWRQMLATLDAAKRPGTRPRANRSVALLYGILRCGECGSLLHRATAAAGRYKVYRCGRSKKRGECPAPVSVQRDAADALASKHFLRMVGSSPVVRVEEHPGTEPTMRLAEIEHAIRDTQTAMDATDDEAAEDELLDRLRSLKRLRREARASATEPSTMVTVDGRTFGEAWAATEDVEDRRALLLAALDPDLGIEVAPARPGARSLDPARFAWHWRPEYGYGPPDSAAEARRLLRESTPADAD